MATAGDYVSAPVDEEDIAQTEIRDVAIFFTSLDSTPVKIGRLRDPKIKLSAEEAEQAAQQYQWRKPKEREEGTHVRLSMEEHAAIDARLNLSVSRLYARTQ